MLQYNYNYTKKVTHTTYIIIYNSYCACGVYYGIYQHEWHDPKSDNARAGYAQTIAVVYSDISN